MSTLAQVQADTLDDSVRRIVVAEQFAEDWQMVAENDYETYIFMTELAKDLTVADLSDYLRNDWERLIEQVAEVVEERVSPIAALFISEQLQNPGSLPFDIIARRIKS